jgi:hypothetical protein
MVLVVVLTSTSIVREQAGDTSSILPQMSLGVL